MTYTSLPTVFTVAHRLTYLGVMPDQKTATVAVVEYMAAHDVLFDTDGAITYRVWHEILDEFDKEGRDIPEPEWTERRELNGEDN
jgi:hypothetical protein